MHQSLPGTGLGLPPAIFLADRTNRLLTYFFEVRAKVFYSPNYHPNTSETTHNTWASVRAVLGVQRMEVCNGYFRVAWLAFASLQVRLPPARTGVFSLWDWLLVLCRRYGGVVHLSPPCFPLVWEGGRSLPPIVVPSSFGSEDVSLVC